MDGCLMTLSLGSLVVISWVLSRFPGLIRNDRRMGQQSDLILERYDRNSHFYSSVMDFPANEIKIDYVFLFFIFLSG
jgi:hypothetical protein